MKLRYTLVCTLFLMVVMIGLEHKAWCQAIKTYTPEDCNTATIMEVIKGDTVLIDCDVTYIVNKTTFRILENSNNKIRKGDYVQKELLHNAFETIESLNGTVSRSHDDYNLLKSRFDSLAKNTITVIDKTLQHVDDASESNTKAMAQITDLKKRLQDIRALLEKERKKRNLDKFKWGIGGLAIGGALATMVFIIK